jgi:hypothetical protein
LQENRRRLGKNQTALEEANYEHGRKLVMYITDETS